MTKKISYIFIIYVLILTMFQPIHATTSKYEPFAERLSALGVFRGSSNGFDLDREPTRLEGLIMLIRLLGVEDEALASSDQTSPFTDVPLWGKGYVNYAYAHGLTSGVSPNSFGTNEFIDANSYMTFLLRALGYSDHAGDFSWSSALDFAKSQGFISENQWFELSSQDFLRDHVAKLSYDVLSLPMKDKDERLIDYLVAQGSIDAATADSILSNQPTNTASESVDSESLDKNAQRLDEAIKACVFIRVTDVYGNVYTGSGFYIDNKGTLVTNFHVIEYADTITVTQDDGSLYNGSIVVKGYDKANDLAILKLNYNSIHYLQRENSDNVLRSQSVYAIGSPLGLQNTISEGIISRIYQNENGKKRFQVTNAISPGSSGGALINAEGFVIGITNAGYLSGENLGLAIPIKALDHLSNTKTQTFDELFDADYITAQFHLTIEQEDNKTTISWDHVGADFYMATMSVDDGEFEPIWGSDVPEFFAPGYQDNIFTLENLMEGRSYRFRISAYSVNNDTVYEVTSKAIKGNSSIYNITDLINDLYDVDLELAGITIDRITPLIFEDGDVELRLYLDRTNTLAFTRMSNTKKDQFHKDMLAFLKTLDKKVAGNAFWYDVCYSAYTDERPEFLETLDGSYEIGQPVIDFDTKLNQWYGQLWLAKGVVYRDPKDPYDEVMFDNGYFPTSED